LRPRPTFWLSGTGPKEKAGIKILTLRSRQDREQKFQNVGSLDHSAFKTLTSLESRLLHTSGSIPVDRSELR